MRFLLRTFFGLLITIAASGTALYYGGRPFVAAVTEEEPERPARKAPERKYTVRALTLNPTTVTPETLAYGRIEAGRVLELRAGQPGRIVDIVPSFRDGAEFAAGRMLMRIDPSETSSREADSRAALADARSRETEARQAAQLAEAELEAALRQMSLQRQSLLRQQELLRRGVAARSTVETEQIAVASAEQTMLARQQALTTARNRIEQARLAVERADLSVQDAGRASAETEMIAPFSGILSDTNAALGRLVNANETLGTLTDPTEMEVSFRLTDAQFGRVLDDRGAVLPLKARVTLELGEREIVTSARLVRAASRAAAEGGRTVFAALDWRPGLPLRPGDFVRVIVDEPPLERVAALPARAVTADGGIYLIGDGGRVSETRVSVLRRLRDTVLVRDVPFGQRIVAELRPQIGPGVLVQTPEEAEKAAAEAARKRAERGGNSGQARPETGRPNGSPRPNGGERPEGANDAQSAGQQRQAASNDAAAQGKAQ